MPRFKNHILCVSALCLAFAFSLTATAQTVTGSGTTNRLPKFTGPSTVGNSGITESAGKVGIGTTAPDFTLEVRGTSPSALGIFNSQALSPTSGAGILGLVTTLPSAPGQRLGFYTLGLRTGGTSYNPVAMQGFASQSWTLGSARGAYLTFDTTPDNSVTRVERMRIGANGNVGIGITAPDDKLSVAGTIQSTVGGFRFPDGTVQTTAATGGGGGGLTSVSHDSTLAGNGTSGDPLKVRVPLVLTASAGSSVIMAINSGSAPVIEASNNGNNSAFSGYSATGTAGSFSSGYIGVRGDGLYGLYGAGSSSTPGSVYGVTATAQPSGTSEGYGVYASGPTYAGFFNGNVSVSGTLSKGAGSFKIDHPLDPEHKYLSHSFVESPDMMNIYNGNAVLDGNGQTVVQMPDWFEALNREFRYQLTAIGAPGPNLYIAQEISNNQFRIAGGTPGMKVSWQVTGVRHDAYAEAHRIPVEEDKPEKEQGSYIHPELFKQSEEKSREWALRPEMMRRMKEDRLRREAGLERSVAPPQPPQQQ